MAFIKKKSSQSLTHFMSLLLFLVTFVTIYGNGVSATMRSLNVILNPGEETCFFQHYLNGETILLEYSVISATYQEHVIGFQLSDIYGRPLVSEFKKRFSHTQLKTTETGPYKVCFDNTQTRYSRKVVLLRLIKKDASGANWEQYNRENLVPEEEYGANVGDIEQNVDKVRVHLNDVQNLQELYRKVELRDRQLGENNFVSVNWYSAICLICTVSVMLIQVISLRSLFEDKSALQRFLRHHQF